MKCIHEEEEEEDSLFPTYSQLRTQLMQLRKKSEKEIRTATDSQHQWLHSSVG